MIPRAPKHWLNKATRLSLGVGAFLHCPPPLPVQLIAGREKCYRSVRRDAVFSAVLLAIIAISLGHTLQPEATRVTTITLFSLGAARSRDTGAA